MKNIRIILLVLTGLVSVQSSCTSPANKNSKAPKEKVIVTHYTDVVTEEDNSFEEMEKFDAYVKKHIKAIPGVKGNVEVGFTNEKDGSLSHVKITKSLSASADTEAMRLVKSYPHWEPALSNGKPEVSQFTIPITFGKKRK